jgi:hypothetical protein
MSSLWEPVSWPVTIGVLCAFIGVVELHRITELLKSLVQETRSLRLDLQLRKATYD